ncbi:MAG: CoB--CoM heterodisulfide reductase iron-sulfur subunit B family protein [Desulfobacterales bacterium]|nr:CoB--CoM heterodisulfide reductase iron-sulfur subunit B family protein [Desulfobacterales bacterium]
MMEFALFLGCTIPARLTQYESSSRAVLEKLGVGLVDIREFNCCGYPLRNIDFKVFLLFSARNLALAEKKNLNVMALCKCCYGSLKKADFLMKENASLKKEVNTTLEKEGLKYEGRIEVKHLLSVLHKDVGIEAIKGKMATAFKGLKIATHYGCHALRPSQVVGFDNPVAPTLFDQLVEVTGAESIEWPMKLECCGAPLWGINDRLSMDLTLKKLNDGKKSGADYVCAACPYCHIQFDKVQKMILSQRNVNHPLPSILYTQLLGLTLGIDRKVLRLEMNEIPISGIEELLKKEEELAQEKALAEQKEPKKEKESTKP